MNALSDSQLTSYGPLALLTGLVTVLIVLCWLNLRFDNYFLRADRDFVRLRGESELHRTMPSLHHFVWTSPADGRWGELSRSPGLALSPELLVESYKCTTKETMNVTFDAVKNIPLRRGQLLVVILKKGACRPDLLKTTPARSRRAD